MLLNVNPYVVNVQLIWTTLSVVPCECRSQISMLFYSVLCWLFLKFLPFFFGYLWT